MAYLYIEAYPWTYRLPQDVGHKQRNGKSHPLRPRISLPGHRKTRCHQQIHIASNTAPANMPRRQTPYWNWLADTVSPFFATAHLEVFVDGPRAQYHPPQVELSHAAKVRHRQVPVSWSYLVSKLVVYFVTSLICQALEACHSGLFLLPESTQLMRNDNQITIMHLFSMDRIVYIKRRNDILLQMLFCRKQKNNEKTYSEELIAKLVLLLTTAPTNYNCKLLNLWKI